MSRISKTKKQKIKKNMKRITNRETNRLGSSCVVNTRHFHQKQSFGAASPVRHINPEEYQV